MRRRSSAAFALSVALLSPALAFGQDAGDAARGRMLAQRNCATCHAIGRTGASPYRLAPPFRVVRQKYNVDGLAEALAEGIVVGNTGERQMPRFVLSVDQIDDLIAYLKSLGPASPAASPLPAHS